MDSSGCSPFRELKSDELLGLRNTIAICRVAFDGARSVPRCGVTLVAISLQLLTKYGTDSFKSRAAIPGSG